MHWHFGRIAEGARCLELDRESAGAVRPHAGIEHGADGSQGEDGLYPTRAVGEWQRSPSRAEEFLAAVGENAITSLLPVLMLSSSAITPRAMSKARSPTTERALELAREVKDPQQLHPHADVPREAALPRRSTRSESRRARSMSCSARGAPASTSTGSRELAVGHARARPGSRVPASGAKLHAPSTPWLEAGVAVATRDFAAAAAIYERHRSEEGRGRCTPEAGRRRSPPQGRATSADEELVEGAAVLPSAEGASAVPCAAARPCSQPQVSLCRCCGGRSRERPRSSPAPRAGSAPRPRARSRAEGARVVGGARRVERLETDVALDARRHRPGELRALRRARARRARRTRHPRQQRRPRPRPRPVPDVDRGGRGDGARDERPRPDAHDAALPAAHPRRRAHRQHRLDRGPPGLRERARSTSPRSSPCAASPTRCARTCSAGRSA